MENFLNKYQEQLKYVSSIVDYSKEYAKSLEEKSQINHKTKEFREKHEKDFTSLMYLYLKKLVNYLNNVIKLSNPETMFQ